MAALKEFTGGLSSPSKMPSFSYNIPAWECKQGAKLMKVAGSTCSSCYAMKGRYGFPNVKNAMYKRFHLISKVMWVEAMVLEIAMTEKSGYFRWHDSGDIQDNSHLDKIVSIAALLPQIKFWLPTREYKILDKYEGIIPQNLVVRFSAHLIDSYKEVSKKQHKSVVVSKETNFDSMELKNSVICHATRADSSHKCESCRACWDADVETVAYLKH
jgi:hypothetical protein